MIRGSVRLGMLIVALSLAACVGASSSTTPATSAEASPPGSPWAAPSSVATSAPTATASAALDGWTPVAEFDEGDSLVTITDISAWSAGVIAIGNVWFAGFVTGPGEPGVWLSPDGRSWAQTNPDFGTTDVELTGILVPPSGGVVVVGTVGSEAVGPGGDQVHTAAWRTMDGTSWAAFDLPSEIAAAQRVQVVSGPLGSVVSSDVELWYSRDLESWDRALVAEPDVLLGAPAAGDEGFVVSATHREGPPIIYASGDGLDWVEGAPAVAVMGVASRRGDWFGWGYTSDLSTISILRSANGLDWEAVLDVNDLTPSDGAKAGLGMESGITEVDLEGSDGVLTLTLGWNHCCATPPGGVGLFSSIDGETWVPVDGPPPSLYVTAMATDANTVVIGGHVMRGTSAGFWAADR